MSQNARNQKLAWVPSPAENAVFVFPGVGSQWPGMARDLMSSSPAFRRSMGDCAQALEPFQDWSLIDVVMADSPEFATGAVDVVWPTLFAVTVSLAELWRAHGVEPAAVIGQSWGEIAAAAVAGALSLDDSARVATQWSQSLMPLSGRGEMVSAAAEPDVVRSLLSRWDGALTLAGINGPTAVVVSGTVAAADELLEVAKAEGILARRMAVGLAAHSPVIDEILPAMRSALEPIRPTRARLPMYLTLDARQVTDQLLDADYWCRNIRNPVHLEQTLRAVIADGYRAMVEISPHPTLTAVIHDTMDSAAVDPAVCGTLRRGDGSFSRFLVSMGELYATSAPKDLVSVFTGSNRKKHSRGFSTVGSAVRGAVGEVLGRGVPAAERNQTFQELGLDSMAAVRVRAAIVEQTGVDFPVTALFDYPTPERLTEYIAGLRNDSGAQPPAAARPTTDDPIAIVGIGCRLPGGVNGPDDLWRLVLDGTDAISAFPADRGWNIGAAVDRQSRQPGEYYQREGGFLYDADKFDAGFFGVSPREALAMDPQQRLLLETSWEAVERARIDPLSLRGTRTGVYVGAMTMGYGPRLDAGSELEGYVLTGSTGSVVSGRLAYLLGLDGPALTVDTACSSSLVALHLAMRALQAGECELALAGGVTVMPDLGFFAEFSRQGALSADGRCRAFSDDADGFGLSEGVGVLVVERLSDARRNGHPVLAVVRGSSVNQDGASNGLTAPSGLAQRRVIQDVLSDAGLSSSDVDIVEAHGTGTRLGDPIEAHAILATYGQNRDHPVLLGTLKSNIGHTQAAAGVAGVIKMVMAIRHGMVPKTLHVTTPSVHVDWDSGAVELATDTAAWPDTNRPRRAGISSFGISGTNAHVIIEQPETVAAERWPVTERGHIPVLLSGRSVGALRAQAARLASFVQETPDLAIADLGLSMATTRSAHGHRAAVVASERDELLAGLTAVAQGTPAQSIVDGTGDRGDGVVFVFPGQGSQWIGMGRQLLAESPVFRDAFQRCAEALVPVVDWSLTDVLADTDALSRVDVVQPALWAVMVSLAEVWRSYGVHPAAVIGHSQGEIAAACVAGVLSIEDGARVVALRARALSALSGHGGMAAVRLSADEVAPRLSGVSLAAVNGPSSVVVAGANEALDDLVMTLTAEGVRARRVDVDYPSHSALVEEIRAELAEVLDGIACGTPDIPMYSTVDREWLDATRMDSEYWYRNLRQTVWFDDAVTALTAAGHQVFVEVSAHPVLTTSIHERIELAEAHAVALGTLRRDNGGLDRIHFAVAEAHVAGVAVDLPAVFAGTGARVIDLPTYPFQHGSYWVATQGGNQTTTISAAVPDEPAPGRDETLRALPDRERLNALLATVRDAAASVLGYTNGALVSPDTTFRDLGVDSLAAVELGRWIAAATGLPLRATAVFDHPTPAGLAAYLHAKLFGERQGKASPVTTTAVSSNEPIAIIGMSCRLPGGVESPEQLWDLVASGVDAVGSFPDDRGWDLERLKRLSATQHGGFLDGVGEFDTAFSGVSPREALAMDPQQRLLLETSWEAVERARIDPASLRGTKTGVFTGAAGQDYDKLLAQSDEDAEGYQMTGNAASVMSGRLAYVLGLDGPALTVDTACSSSLVALHLAVQALRSGECDLALAGGVTVMSTPGSYIEFTRQGGLAVDGRCRSFAASADGTGWSEGVGMLVVERLSDARRNGHRVLALVRGSAVNSDGASNGLTAPSGQAQQRVIRAALASAGLKTSDVDVVEAHGTGTKLGDPIEAEAILATYGQDRSTPIWLGSLKSNIGHTQAAAGVAGVIKLIQAMHNDTLPATLHLDEPTAHVDWSAGAAQLLTEPQPWPRNGKPRRAGVSSFGISGTNAHVIIEDPAPATEDEPDQSVDGPVSIVVSGRSPEVMRSQAGRLVSFLRDRADWQPADVGLSSATTRTPLAYRAAVVAADRDAVLTGLTALAEGTPASGIVEGNAPGQSWLSVVFPGQGAQRAGMGAELYDRYPVFAAEFDALSVLLDDGLDRPLRTVMSAPAGSLDSELLDRTDYTQRALFAVQTAIFRLLESWGVVPDYVMGHSIGEITAAHVAGMLTREDACTLVNARASLMAALPEGGAMAAVEASEDEIVELLGGVEIAAVNSPNALVVSGADEAVRDLCALLAERARRVKQLSVSHPFHSAWMDDMLSPFREVVERMTFFPARIPVVSTLTGAPVDDMSTSDYWVRQVRQPVRFADAVRWLDERGVNTFLELGPDAALASAMTETLGTRTDADVVDRLMRPDPVVISPRRSKQGEPSMVLTALSRLHISGIGVDWHAVFAGTGARVIDLPTYAFQRRRYWPTYAHTESVREVRNTTVEERDEPALRTRLAEHTESERAEAILNLVLGESAVVLGYDNADQLSPGLTFRDHGFDSLMAVALRDRLGVVTGLRLPTTLLFDHPTPGALAHYLYTAVFGSERAKTQRAPARTEEPIAIVGMACRLPGGVTGPDQLWDLVIGEVDAISRFPDDRGWDLNRLYDPNLTRPGTSYTREGGFLHDAGEFDAEFFGVSPREALAMDPQQRLLLETSWEALERAQIDPVSLRGTRTGVFAGLGYQGYGASVDDPGTDVEGVLTGAAPSVAAGRIAYVLGLEGPVLSVDTACSSSLVALHLAVQALRSGECDLALAGGVTVMATPESFVDFSRQGGLAMDGRCRSFAESADGTGWSEGVSVVAVERLSDARRNGHPVLAVIRGSAVNSDGASNGLTAPNGLSQQRVIRAAMTSAGLNPSDVDVVEAHGTGTRLGDPIEAQSILATYGQDRDRPVLLGSLKSNIGHAQAAAGVAGVIKMVQAMRHGMVPKTLHVDSPSSRVDWDSGAVELVVSATEWPEMDRPRRAAVSSFGVSGTNAHVIIEQAEPTAEQPPSPVDHVTLWPLSAPTESAVRLQAERLADHVAGLPPVDVGYSLATTRTSFQHRAVVVGDRDELLRALRDPARHATGTPVAGRLAMVFSGQGTQRPGMGRELAQAFPRFAEAFEETRSRFDGLPLDDAAVLDQTEHAQRAVFAFEVALYRLLESWGIKPDVVVGHSIGEVAAAHVAGILCLDDACALVEARCRLMQRMPSDGAMYAVRASESVVMADLPDGVCVAAINGPESVVISGDADAVEIYAKHWPGSRKLRVSHAFHSHHMDGMLAEFAEVVARLRFASPTIGVARPELSTPDYWVRQVRVAVPFMADVRTVHALGAKTFLEIGPDGVLTTSGPDCVDDRAVGFVAAQRRDKPERHTLLTAVGRLHVRGVDVDLPAVMAVGKAVDLPTYPFEHKHYWHIPASLSRHRDNQAAAAVDDWRYRVRWTPRAAGPKQGPVGTWVVITPGDDLAGVVAAELAARGAEPMVVGPDAVAGAIRGRRVAGVLSLLGPTEDGGPDRPAVPGWFAATVALVQQLAEHDTRMWFTTRGALHVTEEDSVTGFEQGLMWGLAAVIANERPELWGGVIDLPDTADEHTARLLVDMLAEEADQVAVRGSGVFDRRVGKATCRGGSWTPSGTVLVTGGTGALGAHVARWLARNGAEHLVLASRNGPQAPGVPELRRILEDLGAAVTVAACDIADRDALRELLDEHPPDAIVHTAAVLDDTTLDALTADRMARALRAKTLGAWHLHELTKDRDLSAFILFSSLAGTIGVAGQANYAPGNAFLDALAQHRRASGLPATSIAWGSWAGAGFAGGAAVVDTARRNGVRAMEPDVAVNALGVTGDSPMLVADVDWTVMSSGLSSTLLRDVVPAQDQPRESGLAERLGQAHAADRPRLVLDFVRDVLAATLDQDRTAVGTDQALSDLGLDSVAAVELRNRLATATGLRLPVGLVYTYSTPEALAAHLHTELALPGSPAVTDELDRLETALAGLPDDPADRDHIAGRLRGLLARVVSGGQTGFDGVTPDELFAVIDEELGRA
ncbi:SDR family NAD(P)-dependent oxidoreductase [Kibdelosporangium aridum]|uniref:SDR family NAD(P)-dependent oxidoreductase n=1 Tax=Kibdelosporangium aridum TaxID=2030 RepID=UPI0035EE6A53